MLDAVRRVRAAVQQYEAVRVHECRDARASRPELVRWVGGVQQPRGRTSSVEAATASDGRRREAPRRAASTHGPADCRA